MKKIFIDVTQLMQWQGRLTGVPRVQHELISRFAKDKDSIFVTWHGYDFCEIKAEDIFTIRSNNTGEPEAATGYLRLRFNHAKHILGRSRRLKAIYHKMRTSNQTVGVGDFNKIVIPSSEDAFFIAEGIWSDENYIQKIVDFSKNGTKIIQISYDMLPIVTPQYSGHSTDWLSNYARNVYPICSLVLSISQHTKMDIENWLKSQHLAIPKIEVFRLGDDFKLNTPVKTNNSKISSAEFVLCVGTIEARKNHTLLYYTYKQAALKGIELPHLVVVGRKGWRAENVFDLISTDPDVKGNITILENASDEELSWLYSNCRFTIYPSFYEGWGLPIAESMYYGVPCIASNTSSMPEVAGSLVSYFDPTSPEMLLKEIVTLQHDTNLKAATLKAKQYKMTSWTDSYDQVKKYIMGVL